jgi:hypothetical protein
VSAGLPRVAQFRCSPLILQAYPASQNIIRSWPFVCLRCGSPFLFQDILEFCCPALGYHAHHKYHQISQVELAGGLCVRNSMQLDSLRRWRRALINTYPGIGSVWGAYACEVRLEACAFSIWGNTFLIKHLLRVEPVYITPYGMLP